MMEPVGATGAVVVVTGATVDSVLPVISVAQEVRAIAQRETLSKRLIFVIEKLRW
jgi:hypothetical protein